MIDLPESLMQQLSEYIGETCEVFYEKGFDEVEKQGYDEGFDEVEKQGYDEGHEEGYKEGYEEAIKESLVGEEENNMSTKTDYPYAGSEDLINSFFNGTLEAGVVYLGDEGLEMRVNLMCLIDRIAELEERVRWLERNNCHES